MGAITLAEAADLLTVFGVLAAVISAVVAYRGWRHKTGHWLYIPAPNVHSQDPAEPEFWVFPPQELEDGTFGVVIAGALINAGPSDSFSVRLFAEPELDWREGMKLLKETAKFAAESSLTEKSAHEINVGFLDVFKHREFFIPVLRVDDRENFVLVSRLERGNPYLEELLRTPRNPNLSCHWQSPDRKQAHGVHAWSRTILGRRVRFGPDDLCAPFERFPPWIPLRNKSNGEA